MDNFDLKKYLNNNPLLKEETLNEINVLDIVKKKIKKKYGVDVTKDQIRYGDGSPIEEQSLSQLNELSKPKELNATNEGLFGGVTEGLCEIAVGGLAILLKTFPVILAKFGDDWAKEMIKAIYAGNTTKLMDMFLEIEEHDDDDDPWHGKSKKVKIYKIILFPSKKALSVFTTITAALIRFFEVVSEIACKIVMGAGNLADLAIDMAKQSKDDVPDEELRGFDEDEFKRDWKKLIKRNNQTGRDI